MRGGISSIDIMPSCTQNSSSPSLLLGLKVQGSSKCKIFNIYLYILELEKQENII